MATWIESINVIDYVASLKSDEIERISTVTALQVGQLATTDVGLTAKISAYGQLQTLLNTVQGKISALSSAFQAHSSVSSSDTNIATGAISGTAAPGRHSLDVTALAQSEQIASNNTYGSKTDALNMSNVVTVTVGGNSFDVTVISSNSLQDIANNINTGASAAGINAFAYIISTGSSYRLVIGSSQSGIDNAVSISETGLGANALAITMSGPGGVGTGQELTEATDAQFEFDSVIYNTSTNANTIGGIAVNLINTGTAVLTVTQTNPVSEVSAAMQDLISSYNEMLTFITQTQADNGYDEILRNIELYFTNITSTNGATLRNMYILPASGDELPIITGTTPSGGTFTVRPVGLLELGYNQVTGTASNQTDNFLTELASNFTTFQSNLVGTNGIFTQIGKLLIPNSPLPLPGQTATQGQVWSLLNDETYGAIAKTNDALEDNLEQISEIQNRAQSQIDALTDKYIRLAKLLITWQNQSIYMTQQLETLTLFKD